MVVANKNQIMAGKVLAKSFPVILVHRLICQSWWFEQFRAIRCDKLSVTGPLRPIAVAQSWSALNTQYSSKAIMAFITAEVEYIFSTAGALVVVTV